MSLLPKTEHLTSGCACTDVSHPTVTDDGIEGRGIINFRRLCLNKRRLVNITSKTNAVAPILIPATATVLIEEELALSASISLVDVDS